MRLFEQFGNFQRLRAMLCTGAVANALIHAGYRGKNDVLINILVYGMRLCKLMAVVHLEISGVPTPLGHGMQYLQPVQPMLFLAS